MKELRLIGDMIKAFDNRMHLEGVVCYGASKRGKMAKQYFDEKRIKIKCFCDSAPQKWGSSFLGYEVISPKQLLDMGNDVIIYISSNFVEEIYNFLKEQGFRYIIRPQNYTAFFDRQIDSYIIGTSSLAMRFYEVLSHQINIKGFLVDGVKDENFCGKPVIDIRSDEFSKVSKDVFIFCCDFTGSPYKFKEHDNYFDGANILFLIENYYLYQHYLNNFLHADSNYLETALILNALAKGLNIEKPKYADIGAHLPIAYNNTYIFYEKGATGQLVEPLPDFCEDLKQTRPKDEVITAGIGLENAKNVKFYRGNAPSLSTFLNENKKALESKDNYNFEEISVDMLTFDSAIDPNVEIVSIDCEGLDFDIIKSIDFNKFKDIKVICTEAPFYETMAYMDMQGFKTFYYDNCNSIFVRKYDFDKLMADRVCRELYYCKKHLKTYYHNFISFMEFNDPLSKKWRII